MSKYVLIQQCVHMIHCTQGTHAYSVDDTYIVQIVCSGQLALVSRGSGRARGIWVQLAVGGLSHPRKKSIHIYICIYLCELIVRLMK